MQILYEDNHIIAVNKQVGEIVQGDETGDQCMLDTIKAYLKEKYNKPGNVFLGLTHRIDRPVSGIVLFAKTGKALTRLNDMFRDKEMQKTYWAIVCNRPPKQHDTITHYLFRNQKLNKSYAYDKEDKNTKKAVLSYRILKSISNLYLLEIELHTGRHHQIRSQLAKIGCPIRGDVKYGFHTANRNYGINLHARFITFVHPIKQTEITIVADLPDEKIWKEFQ